MRKLSTLPPEFSVPGASVDHDVKWFRVGQRVMSVPRSQAAKAAPPAAPTFRIPLDPVGRRARVYVAAVGPWLEEL
ncbi:hypothetical protein POL72_00340 [Sorangium sp. wiwo2]|uniref:Uncharacterized protein n=1 Tax=Sorangium atrum TaxID=2995308 RepID=A0ABT5BRL6_9BACT|nr:hypothetical protein [Sorangium aterium]MDC0676169.1 hypothetical protein [Sorangium aterium]